MHEIYKGVIVRYLKMGAGQFLRDFRSDYRHKKSMAHRIAVMKRKAKAEEKRMKVHMQQIRQDRRPKEEMLACTVIVITEWVELQGFDSFVHENRSEIFMWRL